MYSNLYLNIQCVFDPDVYVCVHACASKYVNMFIISYYNCYCLLLYQVMTWQCLYYY